MSVFTEHLAAQGFRAIAPDLRGYGRFRTFRPFAMQQHLDDLSQLLEQEKIDRCLILGWSLGGILAIELALRFPDRIQGLILLATAARPYGNHPSVPWWEVVNTALAVILYRLFPQQQWGIQVGKRSLLQYLIQQHTAIAYAHISHEGTRAFLRTSLWAYKALFDAMSQGYNRNEDLAKITIPCLMQVGERDRHITTTSSHETAKLLPNCDWICYPHTAHLLPWEIPDQILTDIDLFLEKHHFK